MEQQALFRLCNINFIDFWDYTPAETYSMIQIGHDKLKHDAVKHAELQTCIMNAYHTQRKDKKAWTVEDFLPDYAKDMIQKEMSLEECERRWLEACR